MTNTPDFCCIGAQKAGTTWLYQMLRAHPDVWGGPFKEVQYFNSLFVKNHRKWTFWHVRQSVERALKYHVQHEERISPEYVGYLAKIADRDFAFKEEWYSHFFARGKNKFKIDVTPEYCTIPAEGVDYFLRLNGAIPVVYLIRDPVSRAISQLRMNISRSNKPPPATRDEWLKHCDNWDIADRGNYPRNIQTWMKRYPNDQILFLPYGRVGKDPKNLLIDLEKFLGLSHHPYKHAEAKVFEGTPLDIPDYLKDVLREQYDGHYKFLETELGAEFMRQI